MAPKALLVFCDGTGMDGTLSNPGTYYFLRSPSLFLPLQDSTLAQDDPNVLAHHMSTLPEGGGGGSKQYATNVLRLSRSVKNLTSDGKEQIVFYQSGVGSEANFTGDPVTGTTLLQALGTAVASKIRDAYNFVAQNYEDGDDICIFGFSRGAYTARKLSGLIDRIGLLERESLGLFFEIWRQLVDGETPTKPPGTRYPRIRIVGVWDTVGSVYKMMAPLVEDATLDSQVEQMQKMEDKLQDLNSQIGTAKQQLKTEMADLERLRGVERERIGELGLVEKEAGEAEDPRIGGLYDWYASCQLYILDGSSDEVSDLAAHGYRFLASLTIHRSILSLKSSHPESENELRLTYSIDPPASLPSSGSRDLILTLLFIPNTRQLASAER
ncbi:hypothetical protein BU15DRAFT_76767 [Melanogaster broomeanus]|nr:hypothetical protein BU15DRAFT_76767 [Melanogaster broomeanus]